LQVLTELRYSLFFFLLYQPQVFESSLRLIFFYILFSRIFWLTEDVLSYLFAFDWLLRASFLWKVSYWNLILWNWRSEWTAREDRETGILSVQLPMVSYIVCVHIHQTWLSQIFTWNTTAWGYGPETTSLYQSHPWVLALLPDGRVLGVLADTTRRCEVCLILYNCVFFWLPDYWWWCQMMHGQIDLRESSTAKFLASAVYPVITFGPFDSPTELLISLSHAIGKIFRCL